MREWLQKWIRSSMVLPVLFSKKCHYITQRVALPALIMALGCSIIKDKIHQWQTKMTLAITTPALLFPATSLLLIAYTSRFLATAQLIRGLSLKAEDEEITKATAQISNLKRRMDLIKQMQFFGVLSLVLCIITMFFVFIDMSQIAKVVFAGSLVCMFVSLVLALIEISISTKAIELELEGIRKKSKLHKKKVGLSTSSTKDTKDVVVAENK